MGHRASFVIRENKYDRYFYSRWSALDLVLPAYGWIRQGNRLH